MWRIMLAGSRNFMRNLWLSTAATAVMTLTLMIIVLSFVSSWALNSTIKNVTSKLDISVYLANGISDQQRLDFMNALKNTSNVDQITYTSQAQAVASFESANSNNPAIVAGTNQVQNAIPASFSIKAKDPNKLSGIVAVVNEPQYKALLDPTAPVSYSGKRKNTIDRIVSLSNFFQSSGLIASAVFIFISMLIIFNTIRMAIFTRRDEIEIMKLVGATKWFIRGPFIFEAALYGIIAAVVAIVLSYSLLLGGAARLGGYIDVAGTIQFFRSYPLLIIVGEIVIGIGIGACSSLLAMGRYLKL
jgi:cell division transport system permease protein